ncbi:MAG: GW dipeptide domain-containing protein [Gracilimonas sp.]|nr:GW dipeptide domain-containing protein [Gracilimonas sp.]
MLFLLTFSHQLLAQQSPQVIFDQANELLESGDLIGAMEQYRNIESEGQVSGALYVNMGIAAVQLDSMGIAKYYFLKAKNFKTTQEKAENALEYVNSQFSRRSAILPKLPWDRAIDWINNVPGAAGIFVIGFLLTLSGLVLLYACWFGSFEFQNISSYIITLIITGSAFGILAFYADYVDQRYDHAIMINNSNRVYQNADRNAALVSIAYEGYDLTVDHWKSNEEENWLYVRLGNGQYGWIPENGVKVL